MTHGPLRLDGRVILVTGASSGIGRDICVFLAELGARVVLAGRNAGRLEETRGAMTGGGHRVEAFDLAAAEEIPAWVRRVAASAGPLDGLVHSAGTHNAHPLRALSAAKWEEVMRVNVTAAMMLAKGFRQRDVCAATGALVFISSAAALTGEAGVSAYASSKAALAALSRSLAAELAPQALRVNCVAPGVVDETAMAGRLRDSLTPEQFAAIVARHPLGLGCPRDVSHAVAFLLAATGRWITGTTLVVDGGYTMR